MRDESKQDILAADEIGTKYDASAKAVWRNREILAPLLKYSVTELADRSVEEIMRLIDADSISEETPISDLPPEVIDRGTEQSSGVDKPITYDINLKVKNPKLSSGEMLVMLHIDLEFQSKYRPSLRDGRAYPLIKRGIYYVARQISAQLGRITNKTNYADIEKAISIWVVSEDIPKGLENTATRYYIEKQDFIGESNEPKSDYDLMELVIIRRGETDSVEPLLDYLNSIFAADIEGIDRYTPASSNPEVKREVESMPGMGEVIFNKGVRQGINQGREAAVIEMVKDGDITVSRAAERLNKSVDEVQQLLNELVASMDAQSE